MNVKNATSSQIEDAADVVGVRPYNLRESGKGYAFQLKTRADGAMRQRLDWRGKLVLTAPYQRLSTQVKRSTAKGYEGTEYQAVVPGAVCWHGHRDFLRELFRLAPDAVVRTAFITYRGAADFEQNYRETRYGKPGEGSTIYGSSAVPYAEACTCAENEE